MKNRQRVNPNEVTPILLNNNEDCKYPKKVDWKKVEKNIIAEGNISQNKQQKIKEVEKKPLVCLDTNIVISLCELQNYGETRVVDDRDKRIIPGLIKIQKLIDEEKIVPVVTPYVLQELFYGRYKYGLSCVEYIKNNKLFVLEVPPVEDVYYFDKVEKTALRYCGRTRGLYDPRPRQGKNKEEKVFQLAYEDRIKRPSLDARIMAEASLLGGVVVTNNVLHYIADGKSDKISKINESMKLDKDAMPYSVNGFVQFFEWNKKFPTGKETYSKYLQPSNNLEI